MFIVSTKHISCVDQTQKGFHSFRFLNAQYVLVFVAAATFEIVFSRLNQNHCAYAPQAATIYFYYRKDMPGSHYSVKKKISKKDDTIWRKLSPIYLHIQFSPNSRQQPYRHHENRNRLATFGPEEL